MTLVWRLSVLMLLLGPTVPGCGEVSKGQDARPPDLSADQAVDQKAKDGRLPEISVDLPAPDLLAPDALMPDQGGLPTGLHLQQGSFGAMGPVGAGNVQLLEASFEGLGRACSGNVCVEGGMVP